MRAMQRFTCSWCSARVWWMSDMCADFIQEVWYSQCLFQLRASSSKLQFLTSLWWSSKILVIDPSAWSAQFPSMQSPGSTKRLVPPRAMSKNVSFALGTTPLCSARQEMCTRLKWTKAELLPVLRPNCLPKAFKSVNNVLPRVTTGTSTCWYKDSGLSRLGCRIEPWITYVARSGLLTGSNSKAEPATVPATWEPA